ncbi:MAG TPA: hypothetical protein VK616_00385 [Flavitalea sp.]|nr:hypothetical protein [Flavitalea sp.]
MLQTALNILCKHKYRSNTTVILVLLCSLVYTSGNAQISLSRTTESFKPFTTNHEDTIRAMPAIDTSLNASLEADEFDEILVTINVQRIGSYEMPAIIFGETAYIPLKELFDILKIRNSISSDMDSFQVFFTSPKADYLVDASRYVIIGNQNNFNLKPTDIFQTETGLYLKSDFFGQVFGLDCSFSFRNLSITLTTKIELPALREMQQELMRKNINQLKGEKKADTTIARGFSWLRFGMVDWGIIATQESHAANNTRINLGLGAIIAGGEANMFLNITSGQPFDLAKQNYYWRHVNNNNKVLRQVTAGKIFVQSTSSLFDQVTGVQFTNTPTTYRRSFGTYTLSDKTEPGWTVELYVNNVLVNYTKADASGFFTFEVPMVYGNSMVKLRFFGPWGEERIREQNVSVPFNFIPAGQFEYTITGGVADDKLKSKFSRVNFNYGLSKRMTIGAGTEYLSSVTSGKSMPFVNASLRLGSNIMVSGEHTYGVRTKGLLNFRLFSDLQFNLSYLKYEKGQKAIWVNQLNEKKAVVTMPFRGKKVSAFTRLTVSEVTYSPTTKFTNAELMFSTIFSNISANLTTNAAKGTETNPYVNSNASLTFRLPAGIRFTPQVQFEYSKNNITMFKGEMEKNIFRQAFINLSYEQYKNKVYNMGIGFRYNFDFAQTSLFARRNKQSTTTIQSARGSLIMNGKTNYLGASNQNSVGRGGLIVIGFLDINNNGKHDAGEPRVSDLQLNVNGGRIEHNYSDSSVRIVGLEAYSTYFLEIVKNSFDNIGWKVQKPVIKVAIEANNFKVIKVPVSILGEVTGTVYLKEEKGMNGLGRIILNIYNKDLVIVAHTLSESDGYFSYMGLPPGSYSIGIDPEQLLKLKIDAAPTLQFTIQTTIEGDVEDGLQFILNKAFIRK